MIKITQVNDLESGQQPNTGFTQAELDRAVRLRKAASMLPDRNKALKEFNEGDQGNIFKLLAAHTAKVNVVNLFFLTDGKDSDEFYGYMDERIEDEAGNFIVHGDEIYDFMINSGGIDIAIDTVKEGKND